MNEIFPIILIPLMIAIVIVAAIVAHQQAKKRREALAALARECTVYDRAYASAPWTLPSVVTLLTSRDPLDHGVLVRGQRIADDSRPLAERTTIRRDMHGMQYTRSPGRSSRVERITTEHTGQITSLGASSSPGPRHLR